MSELMDLIQIGDAVLTWDGHEAVVDEKFEMVNLISVVRVDDGTITGLLAPEEVIVIAPDAQNEAESDVLGEFDVDQGSWPEDGVGRMLSDEELMALPSLKPAEIEVV